MRDHFGMLFSWVGQDHPWRTFLEPYLGWEYGTVMKYIENVRKFDVSIINQEITCLGFSCPLDILNRTIFGVWGILLVFGKSLISLTETVHCVNDSPKTHFSSYFLEY